MRARSKPFVLYKGGLTGFFIAPRGLVGWTQFAVWIALLCPLLLWFADHATDIGKAHEFGDGMALFLIGCAAWLIGGLWWMLARSELVYVVELRRKQQYARWEKERQRRRQQQQQQRQEQQQQHMQPHQQQHQHQRQD